MGVKSSETTEVIAAAIYWIWERPNFDATILEFAAKFFQFDATILLDYKCGYAGRDWSGEARSVGKFGATTAT